MKIKKKKTKKKIEEENCEKGIGEKKTKKRKKNPDEI